MSTPSPFRVKGDPRGAGKSAALGSDPQRRHIHQARINAFLHAPVLESSVRITRRLPEPFQDTVNGILMIAILARHRYGLHHRRCERRSESAHIRRRAQNWHEISRRTLGSQRAGRWTPVNAVSRRRRWPKASVYRGLSPRHNRPQRSVTWLRRACT